MLKQVQHDSIGHGFTLIELLVVVLIIAILAAVAVPQYQKAVEKSRATEALSVLKSLWNSANVFFMDTGSWPALINDLDLELQFFHYLINYLKNEN